MTDKWSRKKFSDESGMALMWAIMLMALAMFIIVPLLFFTQTTLTVNNKVTESVKAQYAAEAGVEEALWRLATPGILPQPGVTPITLPDRINGYLVSYNLAQPSGRSYLILTSWAYANPGSENMSVVRAKMDSGQFLFSYAFSARGPSAHTHELWVSKANIYSLPGTNLADLYSDGFMQFPSNTKVSGTLYARDGIISDPNCDSTYNHPPWGGTCSWRSLPWSQINMWDIVPSPDGLPDSGGSVTINTGSSDYHYGPKHINGDLTITGGGTGRLILDGQVYVDGQIFKTGTQNIVDLSGGVMMLSALGNVSLKYWNTKLTSSAQIPIIMSVNGDISCTGASGKWICALLYAPNSPNGLTSDNFQLFGAANMSGVKNSDMVIEYPSDIKTTRNWPSVYGGAGTGNISAYSVQ